MTITSSNYAIKHLNLSDTVIHLSLKILYIYAFIRFKHNLISLNYNNTFPCIKKPSRLNKKPLEIRKVLTAGIILMNIPVYLSHALQTIECHPRNQKFSVKSKNLIIALIMLTLEIPNPFSIDLQ